MLNLSEESNNKEKGLVKHQWKVKEVGNWYTEFICEKCGEKEIEEPDSSYVKPEFGCEPKETK